MRDTTRRGGALVIAIAILTLGAALLTGSSAAGRRAARSVNSFNAALLAESEAMRVLSGALASLPPADTLVVGEDRRWVVGPRAVGANGAMATTAVRLHRLSARRFALAIDCRIGPEDAVFARRRRLALFDQADSTDSLPQFVQPVLVAQWAIADAY